MRALLITTLTFLNVLMSGAGADTVNSMLLKDCAHLVQRLPSALRDLPLKACDGAPGSQVLVRVELVVPAARVRETEQILSATTGMKPLRFVCCGYETQPVTLALPATHPLKRHMPKGVFRDVSLSFAVSAFRGDDAVQRPLELGEHDGVIILELIDY